MARRVRHRPPRQDRRGLLDGRSRSIVRKPLLVVGGSLGATLAALALLLLAPLWRLAGQFGDRPVEQPSRLYARPPLLETGSRTTRAELVARLEAQGYRTAGAEHHPSGSYRRLEGGGLEVHLRPYSTPHGRFDGGRLEVAIARGTVGRLTLAGAVVPSLWLEAPVLHSYYGSGLKERRPVRLEEVPDELVRAVLAAEDSSFFRHPGLSLRGIARAAWSNFRRGGVVQGGSTLTQQLAKNLFLSHRRSLLRKAREAVLALAIELRYSKRQILQAYLNEIYWGRQGRVNLMGVGAAAWAYFGKQAAQLTLSESALLAGMIQSPNGYSPLEHPERATQRRDWVLERMAAEGWLEPQRLAAARREPMGVAPRRLLSGLGRYAAAAARREAAERFGIAELADRGYELFSTLSLEDQRAAEEAVGWGLGRLDPDLASGDGDPGAPGPPLQAALLSVDPRDGSILAYLGGRSYVESQFDRVRSARRQPGSAFKPMVYLAAFVDRVASPASRLEDSPITVRYGRRHWSPDNADGSYRGPVSVRRALEESLNIPTVRLAVEVGLDRVVEVAHALGIASRLEPLPSLALGAAEVTPKELLTAYATVAAGGRRSELHVLRSVFDREGELQGGRSLPPPQQVIEPQVAFVLTSVLQGVLERGTGRWMRWSGLYDRLAGKTGTTNDRRDSWFVGYSTDRATLVWVGYDDGRATRLSGAQAALPIWGRFAAERRPPLGYPAFQVPLGVRSVSIDPDTGGRATGSCPEVLTEVFLDGQEPFWTCPLHGGRYWRDKPQRRRWLDRLFRRGRDRAFI